MPYTEPSRQIFQEFAAAQAEGAAPLFPCMVGPCYALHRYTEEDEKAAVGDYNYDSSSEQFVWPDHIPGGEVDLASAKIMLEDTLQRYLEGSSNAQLTEDNGNTIVSSLVFKSNAAADRTASAFGDRDVQIGDWVRLAWVSGPTTEEYFTQVTGFVADVVAGSAAPVEDPFREVGFAQTSLVAGSSEVTTPPTRYTTAYDVTAYNGLIDGYPQDTYTIQVLTVGSSGTGLLDGTVLRITSQGNDTPSTVTLGTDVAWDGAKYPIPLGDRGAILNLVDAGAGIVNALDQWDVKLQQDYTEVDVTNTGEWAAAGDPNYTGSVNTKYIITVVQGGTLDPASATAGDVRIYYRTNNGADTAGYLTIPSADFTVATSNDYSIGSKDMKLTFFKGTQFNTGGSWTFSVEAPTEGAIHTLTLRDSIPYTALTDMDLDMFVKVTVEFPEDYLTLDQDYIEVLGNAAVTSDLLGTPELMSVFGGTLYADYRELDTAKAAQGIGYVANDTERQSELGPNSVLNPLGKAAYHSLAESVDGGVGTFYLATAGEAESDYTDALDLLTENDLVWGFVPLSEDEQIKQNFSTHVRERSNPINNQWRTAWVTNNESRVTPVYQTQGGDDLEATVSLFPVGTYRQIDFGAGTLLESNDVRPGDKLRINFVTDSDGNVTYDEYTVDRVNTQTQLITVEDLGSPTPVAVKVEIWRDMTKDEYAQLLSEYPARFNTRRVVSVWQDNPVDLGTGETLPLMYVAAALAGQRGGIPPHAPMSQLDLSSIGGDPQVEFSRDQLNVVAGGGNWVVNKDYTGRVYTRHQLTSVTDDAEFSKREASKTSNIDHISRDFLTATADLFGQGNISDDMMSLIGTRVTNTIESIVNRNYSKKIGPQMINATIIRIERDPVQRDRVIVEVDPSMPDPLNNLPIIFTIS